MKINKRKAVIVIMLILVCTCLLGADKSYAPESSENYLDMRTVIGYSGSDTGLLLYLEDGNGYYIDFETD